MMYSLHLLGRVALESPAGPLSGRATQRRQLAILAMLAVGGRSGVSRDKLLSVIWPEATHRSSRHSLVDAVYRLRHHLGSDAIEGRSAWIRLNPGLVRCDVVAFEKALEAGDLAAAAGEYGGAFLDGVHLRDSTEFEHWREGEVRRLDREARTALEMLADQADLAGDPEGAADWLRRLLGIDPFNSR